MSEILVEAKKYENYQEGYNNDNMFGRYFNINHTAWCALFVSYVLDKCGYTDLYSLTDNNGKLMAGSYKNCNTYCPTIYDYMKSKGRLKTIPAKGDVVLFWFNLYNGRKYAEHIGFCLDYDVATQTLTTIEGNTSPNNKGSQDNGDGVYVKKRKLSQTVGAFTPINKIKTTQPDNNPLELFHELYDKLNIITKPEEKEIIRVALNKLANHPEQQNLFKQYRK